MHRLLAIFPPWLMQKNDTFYITSPITKKSSLNYNILYPVLYFRSLTSFIYVSISFVDTSDKIVQPHILSSKKGIASEVKRELVSEEPTSSSTSMAKIRRDDTKDRGSSIGTRGNHGVMSNMSNMSVSSNPCNAESRIATKRSQSKPQKTVCTDQLEDKLNQLNLAIVSQPFMFSRFQTF